MCIYHYLNSYQDYILIHISYLFFLKCFGLHGVILGQSSVHFTFCGGVQITEVVISLFSIEQRIFDFS